MIKNVIFDLYGTLMNIHTDESPDSFWKDFANVTKTYQDYDYKDLRTKYLALCKEFAKEKEEIEIRDVFVKLFTNCNKEEINDIVWLFRQLSTIYIKPYWGAIRFLKKLHKHGYKVYLLSNAQESFTIPELEMFNMVTLFDDIFISSMYGVCKPNIDFINKLINNHKLNKNECVMIGNDYKCDYQMGLNAGVHAICMKTNLSPKDDPVVSFKGANYLKLYRTIRKIK